MDLKEYIRSIPDYPKKGILFRDITTLIKDEKAFVETINQIIERSKKYNFTKIAAIESRGFLFSAPLCYKLSKPLVLMRKENKCDVMNFCWSYKPNRYMDITYYRFKESSGGLLSRLIKKKKSSSSVSWKGTRFMLIPEGITPDNNSSIRIGFLKGGKISEKFGYEVGYYHDFNSMPLSKVFDTKWNITCLLYTSPSPRDS